MKNIKRISTILFMFFFFIQVNQSNAVVNIPGALHYPLLAQLTAMLFNGGETIFNSVCCKNTDDKRTVAKKIVDVTCHGAAYSGTFASFHYFKELLESLGVDEENASRGGVCLGVLAGETVSIVSNKVGDLLLVCCGCGLTNERQRSSDEEVQLQSYQ